MLGGKNENETSQDKDNGQISLTFGHEGFYRVVTNKIFKNEKLEHYFI